MRSWHWTFIGFNDRHDGALLVDVDAVTASVFSCFFLGFAKGGELVGVSVPVVGECVGCGAHGDLLDTGYSNNFSFAIRANKVFPIKFKG